MAQYEDMLDDVRGAAYGAPDAILVRALRRATQELCKYSQCWRETLDDDFLREDVGAYEFMATFESVVDRVLWVKVDGRPLCAQARPDELKALRDATGMPTHWAQHSVRQELLVWPVPGEKEHNKPLSVCAALSPTMRSTELPDSLVDEYGQGIAARAKWDLMTASSASPWYDPNTAQRHHEQFQDIFARAKRAQHSGHSMPLTVQPRRFV